jgi:CheY-like chemotaxis protein
MDDARRRRVMVVDDDASMRALLSIVLEHLGCTVVAASDGPSALRACRAEDLELAIVDYRMPGMTGLDLAADLHDRVPGLPIVLVSGDVHALDIERARDAGVVRLLAKPFNLREVEECVRLIDAPRADLGVTNPTTKDGS